MAFEGRAHVFPSDTLIFGARPLPVPGAGHVLCVSAALPFRLADGSAAPPGEYYEALAEAGAGAAPDSMAPLPCAEVLVLGPVAPVEGDERLAELRCGELRRLLRIRPDPDAPGAPLLPGPEAALWHEEDNPAGRGGPGDARPPLIVLDSQPERPVWLGATPYLHPARARLMGVSENVDSGGWPEDASPAALCDAHPAFQTGALYPGDPLRIVGLGCGDPDDVDIELPPYRPNLASGRGAEDSGGEGLWVPETARIHTVALLPAAGLGAVIWRASIELGADILAEGVTALVFALEDLDAPERDEFDLGAIAAERWENPVAAMDDRPLLPAALAAALEADNPDLANLTDRIAAAENWARAETGLGDANPFGPGPAGIDDLDEKLDPEDPGPAPDMDAIAAIAGKALQDSRKRHEQAGFEEPDIESLRDPEVRGEALDGEVGERLDRPYRAPQEVAIATSMARPDSGGDAGSTLESLARARVASMQPVLLWPALTPGEGERFGAAALERFAGADPERHVDISSAVMIPDPGGGTAPVDGRTFDGLLAEETVWRDIVFRGCVFRESTFVKARFERCTFTGCEFRSVNFSSAILDDVVFRECEFSDQVLHGMGWMNLRFEQCVFRSMSFMDLAARDTVFEGGEWEQVQLNDSLLARTTFRDTAHSDVIWNMTGAPWTRFERVRLFKVWATARGFAESEFESVEADTCGFVGGVFFKDARFENTRFVQTGFAKAIFSGSRIGEGCVFSRCDFSSAVFSDEARVANARFINCSMVASVWAGRVDASGAWFHGCMLRGVNFTDTRLMNAVFTDADLEGALLDDDLAAGADFRGTTRG